MDGVFNAKVRSVWLGDSEHGSLSAFVDVEYNDGVFQGFGGYALYYPNSKWDNTGKFIWRCMEILEANSWDKCKGQPCRIRIDGGLIEAIGHWTKDKWFVPKEEFKQ